MSWEVLFEWRDSFDNRCRLARRSRSIDGGKCEADFFLLRKDSFGAEYWDRQSHENCLLWVADMAAHMPVAADQSPRAERGQE